MSMQRNGFTVSGRFPARSSVGECPICGVAFVRGVPSAFLKCQAAFDGQPAGPLTRPQRRTYARLHRDAQGIARSRGILPRRTKAGRLAGRQYPASLREVGTAPAWLFDHMIHWSCLPAFAGGTPVRDIVARYGERTVGIAHGQGLPGAAPAADPEREARIAREREARRQEREARRIRERERRAARERERQERIAREAEAREAEARLERLAAEDPSAARFRRIILDDDAPRQGEDDGPDPSVERFRRLDLD